MFDEVYDDIYVGDIDSLKNQQRVIDEGITAIVRLDQIDREEGGQWSEYFHLLDIPIADGRFLDCDTIRQITRFIDQQKRVDGRILVHCFMGVSRSVSMTMAYLIEYEGMSLAEAFGVLREGRPAAYPHEDLLVSLIDCYRLPFNTDNVHNPEFISRLMHDM